MALPAGAAGPGARAARAAGRSGARYIHVVARSRVRSSDTPVSTTWWPATSVIRTLKRVPPAARPAAPPASCGRRPARGPARPWPARAQRPGPVAVGVRGQAQPPAARPAGRDRRQPVAVVDDLHGQPAGPPRGDPQHQRPGERRIDGRPVADHDRAPARVSDPREGRPAQVDRPRRAVRADVHDLGPHRPGGPVDVQVAAASLAGRVAARRQADVPAAGRERAQPATARGAARIVENGLALDCGPGQRGMSRRRAGPRGPAAPAPRPGAAGRTRPRPRQ